MAAFADDDDAAAIDAILKEAPSSKIPELLEEASKPASTRSEDWAALHYSDPLGIPAAFCFLPPRMVVTLYIYAATRWGCNLKNEALVVGTSRPPPSAEGHFDQTTRCPQVVDHRGLRGRGGIKVIGAQLRSSS